MEKYKVSRFLPHNEILDHITALDEDENGFTRFVIYNVDDYGIYLITLLEEIAKKRNTPFWYCKLGDLCMVDLHYVDGARLSALYYYIKAYELDPKNTSILNAILDLGQPPEIILTEEQNRHYATKLLALEPVNERALAIINS